ncbi:MAG TPA: hypothetical protein VN256_10810 [Pyrinomonadaceae bacterium]|nr:hypothetical protein [Pyrinomonadaceae bacterium]
MLYALMVTSALIALAAVLAGAPGLMMLGIGHVGFILSGFRDWLLLFFITVVVPALLVFATVKVWRYCLRHLPLSSHE